MISTFSSGRRQQASRANSSAVKPAGHHVIGEQQIEIAAVLEDGQRFAPVARDDGVVAEPL